MKKEARKEALKKMAKKKKDMGAESEGKDFSYSGREMLEQVLDAEGSDAYRKMSEKMDEKGYADGGYDDSDFSDYEKEVARKQRKGRKYTFVRPGDEKSNKEKRDTMFDSIRNYLSKKKK